MTEWPMTAEEIEREFGPQSSLPLASARPPERTLRPYQTRTIASVLAHVDNGARRVLICAPTGSGKTVMGCELIVQETQQGGSVLVIVHRRELIKQTSDKLHEAGLDHGIISAGFAARPECRVQVASVQTLHRRAVRSERMDLPPATLVLVDECHHATARTWQEIIDAYPNAKLFGLTATPCRSDGRGLGGIFQVMVEAAGIPELNRGGFLVGTVVYAPHQPDLKGVRTIGGDYSESDLEAVMDQTHLVGDVVTEWLKHAAGRPTVVFATSVKHSVHIRDEFLRAGIMAAHLDGTTPAEERDSSLSGLKDGSIQVVCNCMVLTEGWDCPSVSCLVLARPTKSLLLYLQMVGRALRPYPGKDHALILDHSGATLKHGHVDEPFEWSLSESSKAISKVQRQRDAGQAAALKVCPECSAIRTAGQPCSACGWRPQTRGDSVEAIDGDLVRLDKNRKAMPEKYTPEMRDAFHRQLLWIAKDKGYQPGWASYKYREKFGSWPRSRFASPMAPTPEVKSWVRSRQIAYAKGMQKHQGETWPR